MKNNEIIKMNFTGERFVPEVKGDIQLEHLHRYIFASDVVRNKTVLDIACGEGYGSELLSFKAQQVYGVDVSQEAINHAQLKYSHHNLKYLCASCTQIPLEDSSIDVVVSFETIEHHDQHESMMEEIKRVLRTDGILIISSPDKLLCSKTSQTINEFHIKELYKEEFIELIKKYFENIEVYNQKRIYGSSIFSEKSKLNISHRHISENERIKDETPSAPVFNLIIASNSQFEKLNNSFLEQDIKKSDFGIISNHSMNTINSENKHFKNANKILDQEKAQLEQEKAQLEQEKAQLEQEKAQLTLKAKQLEQDVHNRSETIIALTNSKSWKITKTLRILATFFRFKKNQ